MASASVSPRPGAITPGSVTQIHNARRAIHDGLADGTAPFGLPAALMRERGTLKLFLYQPRGVDHQPAHEQDEVYVVVAGSGTFAIGDSEDALARLPFGPGDAIFAPAGAVHRFENFTDDFETWVVMYGPDGGEMPAETAAPGAPAANSSVKADEPPFAALRRLARERRHWLASVGARAPGSANQTVK